MRKRLGLLGNILVLSLALNPLAFAAELPPVGNTSGTGAMTAISVGAITVANPQEYKATGISYRGELDRVTGVPSGCGIAVYTGKEMGTYYGYFVDGKRSGVGHWIDREKEYIGEWSNDYPKGEGFLFTKDGTVYFGDIIRFIPEGFDGTARYKDGSWYHGAWSKGKYSGWGILADTKGNTVGSHRHNGGVVDKPEAWLKGTTTVTAITVTPETFNVGQKAGQKSFLDSVVKWRQPLEASMTSINTLRKMDMSSSGAGIAIDSANRQALNARLNALAVTLQYGSSAFPVTQADVVYQKSLQRYMRYTNQVYAYMWLTEIRRAADVTRLKNAIYETPPICAKIESLLFIDSEK